MGQEHKIALDYKATLDGKTFDHKQKDTKVGFELVMKVLAVPETKVGKVTLGCTLMKQVLSECTTVEDYEGYAEKLMQRAGVDEDEWKKVMNKAFKDYWESNSDAASGRIECPNPGDWILPSKLGKDAYLWVYVYVGCFGYKSSLNPMESIQAVGVHHVYLYKRSVGEGYWKKVRRKSFQPDYKDYIYKNDKGFTTKTDITSHQGISKYRMDCLEYTGSERHNSNCKGEFLEAGIEFVEPLEYYKPGDPIQTTYCTNTKHSETVCSEDMNLPTIEAYLQSPISNDILGYIDNSEGKFQFQALLQHVKTEEREKQIVSIYDIQERAWATMPGNEVGDTILVYFNISNGQKRHDHQWIYTYVWEEGKMPANTTTYAELEKDLKWYDPSKNHDNDGPNGWVLIPIAIGGVLGAGGCARMLIRGRGNSKLQKKPLISQNENDQRYHELRYNTEDIQAIRGMQVTEQQYNQFVSDQQQLMAYLYDKCYTTSVVLDKTGDVAITVMDKTKLGKPIALPLKLTKTFGKGLLEDALNEDNPTIKNVSEIFIKNTVKVMGEAGKEYVPDLVGATGFGGKVMVQTAIDTSTSMFTNMGEGGVVDVDNVKKDAVKSVFMNAIGNIEYGDFAKFEGDKDIFKGIGEYIKFTTDFVTDEHVQDVTGMNQATGWKK